MKTKLLLSGAVLGLLAAGCGTDHENIYFASEVKMPASVAVTAPVAPTLSKADEHQIDMVVFGHLFDRHPWDAGNYSALFLQADDAVVDAMIKKFPDHNPPIKQSNRIDLRANQPPLDKDTGKPVMILGADVGDPDADGAVDVTGRWYAGGAAQGFYMFKLKKAGGEWTIDSVK
jgi:hypothetical protein